MFEFTYTNNKGKIITVESTKHSYIRFCQRYSNVYGPVSDSEFLKKEFLNILNTAKKQTINNKTNKKAKQRNKKHGSGVLFQSGIWNLIVQDGILKTVELNGQHRKFNNRKNRSVWSKADRTTK